MFTLCSQRKDVSVERVGARGLKQHTGKLFTTHRSLIAGRFGAINEEKLREVLGRLRDLFAGNEQAPDTSQEAARD